MYNIKSYLDILHTTNWGGEGILHKKIDKLCFLRRGLSVNAINNGQYVKLAAGKEKMTSSSKEIHEFNSIAHELKSVTKACPRVSRSSAERSLEA